MINICICDDDNTIIAKIQDVITQYFDSRNISYHVDSYVDSDVLLNKIKHKVEYDIYFLDIIMPEITGMHIANEIREHNETSAIIFLTSSPEYAVKSYDVRALNYLLKPISKEKLISTLNYYIEKINVPKKAENLIVKEKGKIKQVPFSGICCFESRRNKLLIHLNSNEQLEIYSTMSKMEELLCEKKCFVRIHRSFIINMNYIKEIEANEITLLPDYKIPLSKKYSISLKNAYFEFAEQRFS